MDFSSSSSSSSSQYKGRGFPANSSKSKWDLPIYESSPHYPPPPPMENKIITLNSQEISSSSNYAYNFSNFNYGGGGGGGDAVGASTADRAEVKAEKGGEDEGGDRREAAAAAEREHMFDKVVTPSDVGKLNRLVIPKQHAEKYFPLDSSSNEKGLLLNFEDRNGKSWRFRYSYWNSSQSYVMTKGWSRFVKEKKLDAGDIVSFQRGVGEIGKDRFYIDWRRRPDAPPPHHTLQFQHGFSLHRPISHPTFVLGPRPPPPLPQPLAHQHLQVRDHIQLMSAVPHPNHHRGSVMSYNGGYGANYSMVNPNLYHQGPMIYLRSAAPQQQMQMQMQIQMQAGSSRGDQSSGAAADEAMVFDSVPVVHGKAAAAKRLRLFGVNMDCTVSDPQDECDTMSNPMTSSPHHQHQQHRLLLDSQVSSPDEAALQLRLHDSVSASSTSATSSFQATDFLDKGKSSMSSDFDI